MQKHEYDYIPIQFYLQIQASGHIWSVGFHLPLPLKNIKVSKIAVLRGLDYLTKV